MSNFIDISIMSPVRWLRVNYTSLPQYNMAHFDEVWAHELIPQFYQLQKYAQKWQSNDIIFHQFQSQYDPIRLEVWTCKGVKVQDFVASIVATSISTSIFNVYKIDQALNTIPTGDGDYYLILKVGSSDEPMYISECIQVKTKHEGTRLFDYGNSYNRQSIIFENGYRQLFRCECSLEEFTPDSDDAVWVDQSSTSNIISSKPFRRFKMKIGGPYGVPDWIIDKLNRIMGNDSVRIDGLLYTRFATSKWEPKREEKVPWSGWHLDIQQAENHSAIRGYEDGSVGSDEILISFNYNTAGHGDYDGPAGNNIIQIIKVD